MLIVNISSENDWLGILRVRDDNQHVSAL